MKKLIFCQLKAVWEIQKSDGQTRRIRIVNLDEVPDKTFVKFIKEVYERKNMSASEKIDKDIREIYSEAEIMGEEVTNEN